VGTPARLPLMLSLPPSRLRAVLDVAGYRHAGVQRASAENLQRGLVLYSVVAWRVLYATLLARAVPALPCTILLEAAAWQALYCAIHQTPPPPAQPPNLGEAVQWLAHLGGYMGRRRDGPPGPIVLWRGLQRLVDLTIMYPVFAPPPGRRTCG